MKRHKHALWGIVLLCVAITLGACRPDKKKQQGSASAIPDTTLDIRYASGFWLEAKEGYRLLHIKDPQKTNAAEYTFALRERGTRPILPKGVTVIDLPIQRFICMTSLQLSSFIRLGATEKVVGISSTRFLANEAMNRQLKEGTTRKIGIEGNFDPEIILSLSPEVILISPFKQGGYDAMKEVGIPLLPHLGYKETTPLGQAEWIKLTGLLIGEAEKAIGIFKQIEKKYNQLKSLTAHVTERPVVLSGEIHGGSWYAVGGKSFLAEIFKDAGADYVFKDDPRSGGIYLDFETVYNQADKPRYWRILNNYPGMYTYEVLKAQDARYADFRAFREKGVIYCNMREKAYYENMPMEPDLLLADFIKVFHPELLPDYEPVYYHLLKE